MRSESSMPTASSCDAIRFLRGMFHRMSPLVEPINEHCQGWSIWIQDLRKDQNWKKVAAMTKSTGLGLRQQRGFLNTSLPNYLPHRLVPHRICFPNSQRMTTLPTFENMCLSHMSYKLTTHSNVSVTCQLELLWVRLWSKPAQNQDRKLALSSF